jgi:hypothetical protein
VGKRIKLPRREGFGSFKPVLKSPASAELCTLFFWLVFAQRFRPQDREIHTGIYNTLSERFVALFWALNNSAAKVRGRWTLGAGGYVPGVEVHVLASKPRVRDGRLRRPRRCPSRKFGVPVCSVYLLPLSRGLTGPTTPRLRLP